MGDAAHELHSLTLQDKPAEVEAGDARVSRKSICQFSD
jgi:hypothetical protein